MSEPYPHVADLGAVSDIIGGAVPQAKAPSEDGETKSRKPQSNHLEPRQFGTQPSMGPEGSTGEPSAPGPGVGMAPGSGYKPRHAMADEAMTATEGVA